MRGWVYVMSNKAMPGLVKVGYSMKDPEARADELQHTGSPFRPAVEYEAMVEEPRDIEQRAHRALQSCLEAKEWFRCTPEHAVIAIRSVMGANAILENYKRVDCQKLEAQAHVIFEVREKKKISEEKYRVDEADVLAEYKAAVEKLGSPNRGVVSYINLAIYLLLGVGVASESSPKLSALLLGAVGGIAAWAFMTDDDWKERKRKHANSLAVLAAARDVKLDELIRVRNQTA